eukprot:scaffold9087_cov18-Tisochrysis_lutea.AAC.2
MSSPNSKTGPSSSGRTTSSALKALALHCRLSRDTSESKAGVGKGRSCVELEMMGLASRVGNAVSNNADPSSSRCVPSVQLRLAIVALAVVASMCVQAHEQRSAHMQRHRKMCSMAASIVQESECALIWMAFTFMIATLLYTMLSRPYFYSNGQPNEGERYSHGAGPLTSGLASGSEIATTRPAAACSTFATASGQLFLMARTQARPTMK